MEKQKRSLRHKSTSTLLAGVAIGSGIAASLEQLVVNEEQAALPETVRGLGGLLALVSAISTFVSVLPSVPNMVVQNLEVLSFSAGRFVGTMQTLELSIANDSFLSFCFAGVSVVATIGAYFVNKDGIEEWAQRQKGNLSSKVNNVIGTAKGKFSDVLHRAARS